MAPRTRLAAIAGHLTPAASATASQRASSRSASSSAKGDVKAASPANAAFYRYLLPFQTKWSDNDQYGHMNNAVYVTYFDSVINEYLVRCCGLQPLSQDSPIALMISTNLTYAASLEFPLPVIAGLSVIKLGKSSVRYGVALFKAEVADRHISTNDRTVGVSYRIAEDKAAAYGEMTHVFVDPKTRRPTEMPAKMRQDLEKLLV